MWLDNDMSEQHTNQFGKVPNIVTGREAGKELVMSTTTIPTTTYGEACAHVEAQHKATNGLVAGGTYMVRFDSGDIAEVELRVGESGIARPVYR